MKTLHYKNTSIAFTDTGKGTAIVLLHGFLENQSMWNALVPVLSQKYRVITIDLLGHGQTEPMGYLQTMEDNADAVHEVLSSLRLRKAVFIGHSMGGYVALAYAELYPESVKGLVLLNSTAKEDSPERKTNRDRAIIAVKKRLRNLYSSFYRQLIQRRQPRPFKRPHRKSKNRSFTNTLARHRRLSRRDENP